MKFVINLCCIWKSLLSAPSANSLSFLKNTLFKSELATIAQKLFWLCKESFNNANCVYLSSVSVN